MSMQSHLVEELCIKDCWDCIDMVKSYLNMHRYSFAPRSGTYFIGGQP